MSPLGHFVRPPFQSVDIHEPGNMTHIRVTSPASGGAMICFFFPNGSRSKSDAVSFTLTPSPMNFGPKGSRSAETSTFGSGRCDYPGARAPSPKGTPGARAAQAQAGFQNRMMQARSIMGLRCGSVYPVDFFVFFSRTVFVKI